MISNRFRLLSSMRPSHSPREAGLQEAEEHALRHGGYYPPFKIIIGKFFLFFLKYYRASYQNILQELQGTGTFFLQSYSHGPVRHPCPPPLPEGGSYQSSFWKFRDTRWKFWEESWGTYGKYNLLYLVFVSHFGCKALKFKMLKR